LNDAYTGDNLQNKQQSHMKKIDILFSFLSILTISAASFIKSPEVKITNGTISARLCLPDKDNGYYRGSRFDWSGVIAELNWNGHSYFGQWFEKYNATNHDAILGPVEAFDPIGFEKAKPGDKFIKIGVGALVKPNDSSYNFLRSYAISNYGTWEVKKGQGQVKFLHTLRDENYSYEYSKIVKMTRKIPQLTLSHSLKNTGRERIETKVYDHNFFVIDSQLTGPGFVIMFPIALTDSTPNQFVEFDGSRLNFLKQLGRRNLALRDLTKGKAANYELRIENRNTGAGVKITCDRAISKLDFWAASKTVCPEPYIDIRLDPGQEFTWKITYDFYTVSSDVLKNKQGNKE
jgi:hypothetical protein